MNCNAKVKLRDKQNTCECLCECVTESVCAREYEGKQF